MQPCAILAHLSRTSASILQHGENVAVQWSPDTTKIVIQVCAALFCLILYSPCPDTETDHPIVLGLRYRAARCSGEAVSDPNASI